MKTSKPASAALLSNYKRRNGLRAGAKIVAFLTRFGVGAGEVLPLS